MKLVITTTEDLKKIIFESLAEFEKNQNLGKLEKTKTEKKYLSRKDAAKYLHITLPTLAKYTKEDIIKSYRVGNKVLYSIEELERAIESRKFK